MYRYAKGVLLTSVQVSGKKFQNFIWHLGLILKLRDVKIELYLIFWEIIKKYI